ncbi:LysR family transcriptional regulator [Acinetobacter shaoyimingii]|uniref:LysR family transcriptional regulator n=1 Tax=Acinetobacter shaoyimingii TaxID=2715164 RepID=A0A6G8RZJ8_9GAMM|nr:LysR family transcriptional regulator [Acinetobacter shaoyimingii]QIO07376.1 LysR family transcriptional regulator [Acinetobacter shaoyimingii]
MNSLPYSIDDLYWFVLIANAGSLSAARRYDIAKSTLSNRLSRLESALNIKLLNRNTNASSLTDAGKIFLKEISPLFHQIETLTGDLTNLEIHPKGGIRIAASGTFGKLVVLPLISKFLLQYPQIDIDIDLNDKKIDLISGGYDLAIRLGELADSTLYAQKIGQVRRILCTSQIYANNYGVPELPEQLADHHFISHNRELSKITLLKEGSIKKFQIHTHLTVTPSEHALAAVEAHLGIAAVAEVQVNHLLKNAKLIHVLPDWSLVPEDIYLVTPTRKYRTLALRLCLDFLKQEIPIQLEKLFSQ